jgi:hypothetical protein
MLKKTRTFTSLFVCALLIGLAVPALAVDGCIEINQAKVLAAGGFPYSISDKGCYRLTSNLTVTQPVNGINVYTILATIDLNGFGVYGPAHRPTCNAAGTGIASSNGLLAIINGTVSGFTTGISIGSGARIEQVTVTGNCGDGIDAFNGLVMKSVVGFNSGAGISTFGGIVRDNIITSNTGVGLNFSVPGGYVNNYIWFNGNNSYQGQVSGGLNLGGNVCGDALCP